eukprot:CAMPEP_0119018966 /NCGR_PEP_ID=MMETSP1176-20130426/20683_1 /TAXON_ID=265551 /ORGANISM="Synedropsis recta cf, Strain CCMP1620" /LENGTH=510 /DNA_ID=CAMNT_0006973083 /DNA_START=33 /DNA_END=1565 /DNA_ORIENTATION=+
MPPLPDEDLPFWKDLGGGKYETPDGKEVDSSIWLGTPYEENLLKLQAYFAKKKKVKKLKKKKSLVADKDDGWAEFEAVRPQRGRRAIVAARMRSDVAYDVLEDYQTQTIPFSEMVKSVNVLTNKDDFIYDSGFTPPQVKAMLKAAPPKGLMLRLSKQSKERQWMHSLNKVEKLKNGDILIQKLYAEDPVTVAQKLFGGSGSRFSRHALIVTEVRLHSVYVAHSTQAGLVRDPLFSDGGPYIVYRATDKKEAAMAAATAEWIAGGNFEYSSVGGIIATITGRGWYDGVARARASIIYGEMQKPEGDRINPTDALEDMEGVMCSEFVVYCYQGTRDGEGLPYIDLRAEKIVPPRLEDFLIKHRDKFRIQGMYGTDANDEYDKTSISLMNLRGDDNKDKSKVLGLLKAKKMTPDLIGKFIIDAENKASVPKKVVDAVKKKYPEPTQFVLAVRRFDALESRDLESVIGCLDKLDRLKDFSISKFIQYAENKGVDEDILIVVKERYPDAAALLIF